MFVDMNVEIDALLVARAFRRWLDEALPSGVYRAWVVETTDRQIVGGGGLTVWPWPPGPRYLGDRLAFVYNVYTEPAHRRRGLARLIMNTVHSWCRDNGITSIALNASADAVPLYQSLGYRESPRPMMFLALESPRSSSHPLREDL